MNERFRNGGFRADRGLSYAKVERLAQQIRRSFGVAPLARMPRGEILFEQLDKIRVGRRRQLALRGEVVDLPSEALGYTEYDPGESCIAIGLSNETYEALEIDEPRARHSLLHETAHAVEHTALLVRLGKLPERYGRLYRDAEPEHEAYMDTEWQANAIAAATLMPAPRVVRACDRYDLWGAQVLSQECGSSVQSAEIRVRTVMERRDQLLAAYQ